MKVFISYSHVDERAVERLKTHAAMLERDGLLTSFFDRDILAGGHLDSEIFSELESSDFFLSMVSPDFLASNYCYERETTRAIELHEEGRIRIIPVLVEDCDWKSSPLAQFKALPKDAKPISNWANENAAYLSVVTSLRDVAQRGFSGKSSAAGEPNTGSGSMVVSAKPKPQYRLRKSFDEIDRIKFREEAFATIRDFFKSSASEIGEIDRVRALSRPPAPNARRSIEGMTAPSVSMLRIDPPPPVLRTEGGKRRRFLPPPRMWGRCRARSARRKGQTTALKRSW